MTPSRWFILLFAMTIFLCRFFFADAASLQYENQVIERLDVEMMNMPQGAVFDVNSVKARIKTKEGSQFYQTEFDNDLKNLARDFDRIEPILDCVEGKIYITLKIWPKPTIRQIIWKGNCKVSSKDLSAELCVPRGTVFDRQNFNTAFHKLKTYYVTNGFFEAELDYVAIPVPMCNQVDIEIIINEGRAGRIEKIVFCNFSQEETDELADQIVTKPYCFFTSWLTNEGTYQEEAIHQDEFLILNYLQNKGYADAKVWVEVLESKCDRIIIKIFAYRGEKYHFGCLRINGNRIFCTEEIAKRIRICPGDVYSPEALRNATERVTNYVGRYGYIDAIVDFEPKLSCEPFVYDIDFTIEEGDQYRIGLIKVLGNCSTQTNVILHETLLVPGEVFNIEKLKATEARLTNVGFFSSVNVYAVKSEDVCGLGSNYRDVHIEVQETNTGQFGASFGFSTQESIFGSFNITEKNFNSSGLPNLWSQGFSALRGGGEYTAFTATVGVKSRSYDFSWTKPYFMDSQWTVGYEIESASNRYIADDYTFNTLGYTLRGSYQLNAFMKTVLHYRILSTKIDVYKHSIEEDADEDVAKGKIKEAVHRIEGLEKIEDEIRNSGLISAVGAAWVYDSTNHPLKPSRGYKSRIELEYAGVGGKHTFFNLSYLNSYFWQFRSIDECGIWKFRADTRYIIPVGSTKPHTIPLEERFFLGGGYVVRGYRPFRLGPQYEEGDPRGGISLQFLSLEYMRPLYKRLEIFFFADSGHLSLDRFAFGRMSTAVGLGLRIGLLPGAAPLVLGMGFPINPQNRGQVKRFFFELGGQF